MNENIDSIIETILAESSGTDACVQIVRDEKQAVDSTVQKLRDADDLDSAVAFENITSI